MSKGIGYAYINKYRNFHRKNKLTYIIKDGIKYALPRFYKDKIFKTNTGLTYIDEVGEKQVVDETTGEIFYVPINKKVKVWESDIDLSEIKAENQLKKLKKLKELYKGMLHKDIDDAYKKRYEKYNEMFNSLKRKIQ